MRQVRHWTLLEAGRKAAVASLMLAAFEMAKIAGNAQPASRVLDYDWIFWLIIVAVAVVIGVIASIGIANWRARRALDRARTDWATIYSGRLAGENNSRPNPLRGKVRRSGGQRLKS